MDKLVPILKTKSLEETIFFYETLLGFKASGNFSDFVSLSKDDIEIMFIFPGEETFLQPSLTGSLFIWMKGVDEFWEAIKEKVRIKSSIENREYLVRDFSILDNNGYELVFGEDISNT